MPNVFSVPIFLVTFREALETAIVVSVLLAFLKQTVSHDRPLHKTLVRQVSNLSPCSDTSSPSQLLTLTLPIPIPPV